MKQQRVKRNKDDSNHSSKHHSPPAVKQAGKYQLNEEKLSRKFYLLPFGDIERLLHVWQNSEKGMCRRKAAEGYRTVRKDPSLLLVIR